MITRVRRIEASQADGEPVCLLTREEAERRQVRPDQFFERAELHPTEEGFEARIADGEEGWRTANIFVEEESRCCLFFSWEVREDGPSVIVRAEVGTPREHGGARGA